MKSAPTLSAHTRNCPMAAARNVSPAASRTGCPSSRSWWAIFPIVVVFPTPFTPTTRTTNGYGGTTDIGTILGAGVPAILLLNSLEGVDVRQFPPSPLRPEGLHVLPGEIGARVGQNERFLQFRQDMFVHRTDPAGDRLDVHQEEFAGFRQSRFESREEGTGGLVVV